jgi:hypothetical protein
MNGSRTTATALVAIGLMTVSAGVAAASARTATRPAAEHVPVSIHKAEVLYDGGSGAASAHLVKGARATRLITLFDALKREPLRTIHCDIAGGPMTIVTFQGANHVWKATEGACTNVVVTRDGKPLPTLLPSRAWAAAVHDDLR